MKTERNCQKEFIPAMSEWWNDLDILGKFLFGALFASLGIQFVLIVCLFICVYGGMQ